jgi:hypothetical protein
MELLNDSLDQWHRAYAHVTEGNDVVPILRVAPRCQRKLGQFTRNGSLGWCTCCEHMLSFLCYCDLLAKICNVTFF